MVQGGSGIKVTNRLIGASCAGVLAVYMAGYTRTQSAANRLAAQIAERRSVVSRALRGEAPLSGEAPLKSAGQVSLRRAEREPEVRAAESFTAVNQGARPIAPEAASTPIAAPEPSHSEGTAPSTAPAPVAEPPKVAAENPVAAPVAVTPSPASAEPAPPAWKDGSYSGWGYSRHGNIEATVVIEGGRIASAVISQCRTRYSCSVIDMLPPQVALRQSPDVDYVSGATQSANAFYGAVVEALGKAK
jgi:uncharacterized protein with FMN-binding domain